MREKKWVDCPACGAKKSMHKKEMQQERLIPPGYPPLDLFGLDGQFCDSCGEGIWSLKSERRIASRLADHMAEHDASRVVAAELVSVQEAAEAMDVTVQGIHKMMKEGRLRYVVAGGSRLPIRSDLLKKANARTHASV